ncbi:flagellar biosynthetic protein FliO [Jiella marina]|uniref:flagellar biosynthetic protein FliO n=1 Tax=Jiella sp. LLJ827 TaxID=2917712 RepID=UPI00210134B9|nr:flagellar biosynthetic protein FliO [Jiella sp. LLJ827]MCQ0989718.1 flagellar biosynthetic protein FliO [Jiella sp. LLJ827]
MPQWIIDLFGSSLAPIVWVAFVAAIVCILAIGFLFVAKRFWGGAIGSHAKHKGPRLAVVDMARIDEKRKLVLVKRDDVEHLVLVGGQTELLVEAGIRRGAMEAPSSAEPTLDEAPRPPAAVPPAVAPRPEPTPEPEPAKAPAASPKVPVAQSDAASRSPSGTAETPPVQPTTATVASQPAAPVAKAADPNATRPREERPTSVASRDERPKRGVEAAGALAARVLGERTLARQPAETVSPVAEKQEQQAAPSPSTPSPSVPPRSRATPTLPPQLQPERSSDTAASPSRPESPSRRPRAFERIEPHIDAPLTAELDTSPDRPSHPEQAVATTAPSIEPESATAPFPARKENNGGSTLATTLGAATSLGPQRTSQPGTDRPLAGRASRGPLSVKSFAMAIQNRGGRGETEVRRTSAQAEGGTATKPAEAPQKSVPAAEDARPVDTLKKDKEGGSLEDSLESFLSAELTSNFLSDEPARKEAAPSVSRASAARPDAPRATSTLPAQANGTAPANPSSAAQGSSSSNGGAETRARDVEPSREARNAAADAGRPSQTETNAAQTPPASSPQASVTAGAAQQTAKKPGEATGSTGADPAAASAPSEPRHVNGPAAMEDASEKPGATPALPASPTAPQPKETEAKKAEASSDAATPGPQFNRPQASQPQPARTPPAGGGRPVQWPDAAHARNMAAADHDRHQQDAKLEEEMERLLGNVEKAEETDQAEKKS